MSFRYACKQSQTRLLLGIVLQPLSQEIGLAPLFCVSGAKTQAMPHYDNLCFQFFGPRWSLLSLRSALPFQVFRHRPRV